MMVSLKLTLMSITHVSTTEVDGVQQSKDAKSPPSRHNLSYDIELPSGQTQDNFFTQMFMDENNPRKYKSLGQLDCDVDTYEQMEGVRLIIRNSTETSRIYICRSHVNCCFRAKFGKARKGNDIVLKRAWTHPFHSGAKAPATAKGQAHKKRLKGRIERSVDLAHGTNHKKPGALDIVKTAGNFHSLEATYKQAYRAMEEVLRKKWEDNVSSFHLVLPYLERFVQLNVKRGLHHQL